MGRLARPLAWVLFVVCLALGCRAIIGLEEAEPYPEQSSSGAAGAGASSTGGYPNTTTTGGSGAGTSSTGGTGAGPVYDKSARESTRCEASANPAKPDRMSRKPKPIGKTANPIQLGIRQTQSDRGNGKSKEIGQSKSSDAQAGAAEVQRDCGAHRRVET